MVTLRLAMWLAYQWDIDKCNASGGLVGAYTGFILLKHYLLDL